MSHRMPFREQSSRMNAPVWQRALELFEEASRLPADAHAAFLDSRVADRSLRLRVERLLAADSTPNPVFDTPFEEIAALAAEVRVEDDIVDRAGDVVGPYRLLRLIGRGGMGEVYLGERTDADYQRQVAVKLVKRGMDSDEILRRFRSERQILAGLEHPNIARMYDGGLTADGRPYLAMEYVAGEPIDRYCDERDLTLEQRIDLFRAVCKAVQFAHQRLVVHRDLKPSNILVLDDGTVKLLDFGIAKLLSTPAEDATQTQTGMRLLTPKYASPEQASAKPVTTVSDLYSLGVVLYELLSGASPDVTGAERATTAPTRDPEPPSRAVLRTNRVFGVEQPDFGSFKLPREAGTQRLARALRGDLDTIIGRTLKLDPSERFDSAAALEDDLRRYRQGLPIESRPDSAAYRVRKFVGRNRFTVAATVLVTLAIAASAVVSAWQAERARRERDLAEQVSSLMEDLFWSPNPYGTNSDRPDTLRIRDWMAAAATRVRSELGDQPEVQGRLLGVLGHVHRNLGLFDEAADLFRDGVAAAERVHDRRSATVAGLLAGLGYALTSAGRFEAADTALREAIAIGSTELGAQSLAVAEMQDFHGRLLLDQRRYEEALPLLQASVQTRRRQLGEADAQLALSLNSLASALTLLGRSDEATATLAEAINITRATLGEAHPSLAAMFHNLSFQYRSLGRHEEAERPGREAVRLLEERLGPDHPEVAFAQSNLGQVLDELGRHAEADSLTEVAITTSRRRLGPMHPSIPVSLANYGSMKRKRGDLAAADSLVSEAVEIQRTIAGDADLGTAIATNALVLVRIEQARFEEAQALLNRSLPILEGAFPSENPRLIGAHTLLARVLAGLERFEDAERILRDAYDRARPLGDGHPVTQGVLRAQAELLERAGRNAEADSVRGKLTGTL